MNLDYLGLQVDSPLAHPNAKNFRPPSWPPPSDWSPIVDSQGVPQCYYSDSSWPLDIWAGKPSKINFGDGQTKGAIIDKANADLLRLCVMWFIWGTRGCRVVTSLRYKFTVIKPLFVVCANEGIVATDLMRFPAVIHKVAASLAPAKYDSAITILHDLLDAREDLGFCILDKDGLGQLISLAPAHEAKQTPYIPSRIWSYQVSRIQECLQDYEKHQAKIKDCFDYCLDAYSHNFGSLKNAVNSKTDREKSPFQNRKQRVGTRYHGSFKLTADRFGVTDLIERWVGPFTGEKSEKQITKFSQYLDLVSKAGLAYLLNFSLMRIEEGWNLRSDCLIVEKDEMFGDFHILCGETTKTDPDADARWPTSKSSTLAINAMRHIAFLRLRCAKERIGIGLTPDDEVNPYLISYQYEPWSRGKGNLYSIRPRITPFQQLLDFYPQLLDSAQLNINAEDLRLARLITPSLDEDVFKSGLPWRFGWHQLRRTGAVNMLSSDMVDESSLQFLLKHQSRLMVLYYGRNHSRLNLSEETRTMFVKTMYEELSRNLLKLPTPQFVSPLGIGRKEAIVSFIAEIDANNLDKAAKKGEIGARRIRAGFCVNHRPCPYGGIEAIAHCLGGEDGLGCPDLLVDVNKVADIKNYEMVVDDQLSSVFPDSPRHQSLQAEKRAIWKFYEVIKTKDR